MSFVFVAILRGQQDDRSNGVFFRPGLHAGLDRGESRLFAAGFLRSVRQ